MFRTWPKNLPPDVELLAVQLPGREKRIQDPPCRDMGAIVRNLHAALLPYLDRPLAFFGYSMGTRIAYELAREIRKQHNIEPAHMFIAACKAPHIPEAPNPRFILPDSEFTEALRDLGGTPDEILDNRELMELCLPAIRADFALKEGYVYTPCEPFSCPLTAYCGDNDNEAPPAETAPWSETTMGTFRMKIFAGEHFFINDHLPTMLSDISYKLSAKNNCDFAKAILQNTTRIDDGKRTEPYLF